MKGHQLRVARAYRGLLKLQLNWTVSKPVFYDQIPQIRSLFEQLRNEPEHSLRVQTFLQRVESDLETYKHPDPYMFPYYEGGTKWQRNLPPPAFVFDPHSYMEDHK